MPKSISLHDVLEPLRQALLASRDVIISSQICGSNLQKVFTLGDGCWLPIRASVTSNLYVTARISSRQSEPEKLPVPVLKGRNYTKI